FSLVADGRIERGPNADGLREHLRTHMLQRPVKGAAKREPQYNYDRAMWPFRHLRAKLFSIAAAILLWVMVSGEETVERGLRVPLELQQFPAGLEISGELPTTVDVRVRGGSTALSRMAPGDVVAVLDLRSARSGQRVFSLTPEQVRVPFGISIVQVAPSAIAMVFEK